MEYKVSLLFFCTVCLVAVRTSGVSFENVFKDYVAKLNSSSDAMDQCNSDLMEVVKDLSEMNPTWAWNMLDSTSKLRSGIGLLSDDIGQFDQCLGVSNEKGSITGKYCLGSISFDGVGKDLHRLFKAKEKIRKNAAALTSSLAQHSLTWAACLPSSCSSESFEKVFNLILQIVSSDLKVSFTEEKCYTLKDDTELSTGAIITIVIFSLLFIIMILSTFYDLYSQHFSIEPNQLFLAFSMYTNSKKLFTMTKTNQQLECLNGLKFYSMLWVIIGHTYSLGITSPLYNFLDLLTWADKKYSMLLISGTLSVDTFFVVGGALVSYLYMQSMEKGKKFNIILFYLHRYIRLTPALGALALVLSTVYPYLGSGPYWFNVRINQKMCQDYWWATIFYFQNYLDKGEICAGHSWYLAVDTQLYIVSPIILYLLRRFPKYTIMGIAAVVLGICGMNFGLTWSNHYTAVLSNIYGDNTELMMNFYVKTHTRANVWLTGIAVGYVIHQIRQKRVVLRLNKILISVVWICCLALMLVCIFIGHESLRTAEYQEWGNSLHIAFVREIWALGICWIMIVCISGYGGPINWFLSLPVYQVFNRFSYSIYLIHYSLIVLWYASTRSPIFFRDLMMGYYFWGNLCFTCIVSYFWVLAFESPVIILEKILLKKLRFC